MMLARFNYLGLIFAMTWSIHASGTIVVKANVSGCSVYIDGIHVGITPVEYEAPEGEHSVYVTKQYYETFKTKVFVEENIVCRVEATLDSKRDLGKTEISKGMTQLGRGNLTVKTNPSFGSKVYLDGTYLFEAPQTQKGISAGQYELRIAFAGDMGNADTSMRIEINDNKTLAVEIDWNMHFSNLKKGVGALLIDGYAEQYALVHDGSQAMVRNGKTIGGLNPGTYSLVVVDPRFVSEELTVDIQGGAITKISEWEPKYLVSAPPPPVKQPRSHFKTYT